MTLVDFGYVFKHCGFIAPKTINCLNWLSSLWIVSVPDEGYSRNASFALNLRSTLLLGKDIGTINVISNLDKFQFF